MNSRITLSVAALIAIVVAAGCSSKSSPTQATAKKGGGATTAIAAKTSGQKTGAAAKQNKAKATAKGPSVGGTGKQKGGGMHGAVAAKTAGQKATSSSKAVSFKAKATDKGASISDAATEVACDADHELEAFCADDTNVSFCSGGHWYALDCAGAEVGFCGEDVTASTVDCYAATELVVSGEVLTCDAASDGVAYCADDDREVFCDQGAWYELSCASVAQGFWCGEEDETHIVDCGQ